MYKTGPKPFMSSYPARSESPNIHHPVTTEENAQVNTNEASSSTVQPQDGACMYTHTPETAANLQSSHKKEGDCELNAQATCSETQTENKQHSKNTDHRNSPNNPQSPRASRSSYNEGSSPKRFKSSTSDSDDEDGRSHTQEMNSASAPTPDTAVTRSAQPYPRRSRSRLYTGPEVTIPSNETTPLHQATPTPPRTLQFAQPPVRETRNGGPPSEIVTPESKTVILNNGQLEIGYRLAALVDRTLQMNNDSMLDNNGRPLYGRYNSV